MHIQKFLGVENAIHAKGTTVVIDVLRAATVAAFFLDKGVKEIIPVATKEEAYQLKAQNPSYLLAGETWGIKTEGFDFGNSPFEISREKNLKDKVIVQCTTRGTKGIANARSAAEVIFGSFVCASAVERYIKEQKNDDVSIVSTMEIPGSEDELFADYLIARLQGEKTKSIEELLDYMKSHPHAEKFLNPKTVEFHINDFYLSLELDRFDFVPLMKDGRIVKHQV